MTFFVRNIALVVLILALAGVLLVSYLSGRIFYESMLNRVFSERVALIEALGATALSNTDQAGLASLDRAFQVAEKPGTGMRAFRLVDPSTRRILVSVDSAETGTALDRPLPETVPGGVKISITELGDSQVIDLTYPGAAGVLWMTLDRSFFTSPSALFAVQNGFVLTALVGILALIFYLIARHYFMRPLQILKQSIAGETSPAGAKKKKDDFGGLLESFAGVAEKVEETLERDRLVSQMKSDFISTTAHQLRTPLSGINWALGALLTADSGLKPEQRALVERALEKDKELINLVGTLLNAASIEEGKFGYRRESVQLREEVEKVVEEERTTASQMKVQLSLIIPEEQFPELYIDRERVRWVIRNLVENAIRYSPEGSEVVVRLSQDPKQLQVSVKDLGIGISARERPYIFQKFFRADAAQKMRNEGSGLGLFIAKNIVNYHGGRIWFESEEQKGSTFYFTLPATHRESAPVQA